MVSTFPVENGAVYAVINCRRIFINYDFWFFPGKQGGGTYEPQTCGAGISS